MSCNNCLAMTNQTVSVSSHVRNVRNHLMLARGASTSALRRSNLVYALREAVSYDVRQPGNAAMRHVVGLLTDAVSSGSCKKVDVQLLTEEIGARTGWF